MSLINIAPFGALAVAAALAFVTQPAPAAESCPSTPFSLNENGGTAKLTACFWQADAMNVVAVKRRAALDIRQDPIVYVLRLADDGSFDSFVGMPESALTDDMEEHDSDDLVTQVIRSGSPLYGLAKQAIEEISQNRQGVGFKPDSPALFELIGRIVPPNKQIARRFSK